ncbi:F-box/FBD/LRR-repeat protein At1g13570-like [Andrographis paniculata]|uniref:F-box/FBD/LRR-repeat protein At1g13570-like n=1 Tax=Andrographis paniculata TaxID=175694 RepID=UPI0021E79846|nr:F-box/FBD/LRR-repeat protein At1g13570-like [Andrographis paniculata]XP_051149964.1 F-box/FBD/LRR-repeat protein At1g13570-like [Andrographis paniculata]XP_051149965.1 F-box/FBD/LRR-repeat protein At1g13570-like [Andrographis paniculata]XP_051149966.1 F-box/FBD/LRR-repeat protein At1g13570-like [Andrographis paniculata]XP_051149967.1 F-box/FBD/LRR-repeat protein At1g13570-like [Andrographis paniculata]XP_051149968.1 F-box/FBD/LRR-repeat protein At1g13570-like [Andrographis paniculata]
MASDRITGLPDNTIDEILKYLPLKEVVRTSVLSREWRYKWLSVPHLDFSWDFQKSLPSECPIEGVISHILLLHKGPIVKFSLRYSNYAHVVVSRWLQILKTKCVEDFSLGVWAETTIYAIPSDLFSFHLLRHLQLNLVAITLPTTFKGFPELVKLTLELVEITYEELRMFICSCPKLEWLYLHELTDVPTFWVHDVDAPKLKYLELVGNSVELAPTFNGFSLLAELRLSIVKIAPQVLQRFLSECPLLELVYISSCYYETPLSRLDINATNLKLSSLIQLELANVQITPEGLESIISKCPMFERLSISSCFSPTTVWCLDIDAPNLRELVIKHTGIKLPPTFHGFSRLASLCLAGLVIDPEELQLFISKCPVLHSLTVRKCNDQNGFWPLNIDAPNLRVLNLDGLFSSICAQNTQSVQEVSAVYPYFALLSKDADYGRLKSSWAIGDESNMIKFFGQLPSIVKLEVGISFLQFLALGGVPRELPSKLNDLKTIELKKMNFGIMDHVNSVVCLIRSSPKLYSLVINFEGWQTRSWGEEWSHVNESIRAEQTQKAVEYMKDIQKQNIPYNDIKIVKMKLFEGTQPEWNL